MESEKVRARHRKTLCEDHLNPTCQRYAEALVCNREVLCEAYECKEALSKVSEGQEDRLDIDVPLETWAEVRAFVKDDEGQKERFATLADMFYILHHISQDALEWADLMVRSTFGEDIAAEGYWAGER